MDAIRFPGTGTPSSATARPATQDPLRQAADAASTPRTLLARNAYALSSRPAASSPPLVQPADVAKARGPAATVQWTAALASAIPTTPTTPATTPTSLPAPAQQRVERIIAGRVPGGVGFSTQQLSRITPPPMPVATSDPAGVARPNSRGSDAPLQMYTQAGERNAAATGVELGRQLDVSA